MARKTSGQWVVALKKGSTWGTAVALNSAGRMIKVLETGPLYKQREYIIDDSIGISFRQNSVVGKGFVDVTLSGILHFASPIWEIIAQIMGDDTVGAAGSDYSHVMKFQDTSAGLFSTLCAYDGNVVREIPSVKWTSFTIKGAGASLMEWTAKGIGNASLTTGQTNTALGSVTHVGDNYVPFNVTMHINDQSGDTLGAGALVYASEFEFSVDRKFEAEYLTSGTLYETGEPPAKGFTESILNVTFPYEQDNYTFANSHADHIAGTGKKLDIIVTGDATGNGNNFTLTIQIPRAKVEETNSTPARGNVDVPHILKLAAEQASAAPTGMTGITRPTITLLNTMATAYDT